MSDFVQNVVIEHSPFLLFYSLANKTLNEMGKIVLTISLQLALELLSWASVCQSVYLSAFPETCLRTTDGQLSQLKEERRKNFLSRFKILKSLIFVDFRRE